MRLPRRLGRAALLVALVVPAWAMVPGAPAWAGDGVVASNPSDRAALLHAPTEVTLTFSAQPDAGLSHITAWDPAHSSVDTGDLTAAGNTLHQPVAITAKGTYSVAYHVVFTDGQDMVGVLYFTVGTGVPPVAPPAAVQQADKDAVALAHDHGVDPLGGALLVVDVVVLAIVVFLLVRRPARRRLVVVRDEDGQADF